MPYDPELSHKSKWLVVSNREDTQQDAVNSGITEEQARLNDIGRQLEVFKDNLPLLKDAENRLQRGSGIYGDLYQDALARDDEAMVGYWEERARDDIRHREERRIRPLTDEYDRMLAGVMGEEAMEQLGDLRYSANLSAAMTEIRARQYAGQALIIEDPLYQDPTTSEHRIAHGEKGVVRVEIKKNFSYEAEDGSEKSHELTSLRTFKNVDENGNIYVTRFGIIDIPIEDEVELEDGQTAPLHYTLRQSVVTMSPLVSHALEECGMREDVGQRMHALWTLATHDYIHGLAVPFPEPVPEAFQEWQKETMGGPLISGDINRAPNYENGSGNMHYRLSNNLMSEENRLNIVNHAFDALEEFRERMHALGEEEQGAGQEGALAGRDRVADAVVGRLASDFMRAAEHTIRWDHPRMMELREEYGLPISQLLRRQQEMERFELGDPYADETPKQQIFNTDEQLQSQSGRPVKPDQEPHEGTWEERSYRFAEAMQRHRQNSDGPHR